jgi:hypothetical protein
MIKALSVSATILLLAMGAVGVQTGNASEQQQPQEKADNERGQNSDCSQQVWPHISPACLRNADSKIEVRLVTVTRR